MRNYQGGAFGTAGQINTSKSVQGSQQLKESFRFVKLIAVMVVVWICLKRGWAHSREGIIGVWKQGSHPWKPLSYSWSFLFCLGFVFSWFCFRVFLVCFSSLLVSVFSLTCTHIPCWSFLSSYRLIAFLQECFTIVPVCRIVILRQGLLSSSAIFAKALPEETIKQGPRLPYSDDCRACSIRIRQSLSFSKPLLAKSAEDFH